MSDFSFVGTAECDRCGAILSSSDADCDLCSPEDLSRYHFEHMTMDETEVTWSVNPVRAWHDLMQKVDDPLPWRCVETGDMTLDIGLDVEEIHADS